MSILSQVFSSSLIRGSYSDEKPLIDFNLMGSNQEKKRMTSLINLIAENSKTGKAVLEKAAKQGYTLSFEPSLSCGGWADADKKALVLSPVFSDSFLANTLVHESRHAGQFLEMEKAGIPTEFGQHNVRSEIMMFRAMEADACAMANLSMLEINEKQPQNTEVLSKMNRYDIRNYKCIKSEILSSGSENSQTDALKTERMNGFAVRLFDNWYQDEQMVAIYEDGYVSAPMKQSMQKNDFSNMPYDKNVTSRQVLETICKTEKGCYFSDKDKLNLDRKYLEISIETKLKADKFFNVRKLRTGLDVDKSYQNLPVRYDPYLDDYKSKSSQKISLLHQKNQQGR